MAAISFLRGHNIYFDESIWRYIDNNEPTVNNARPCGHCKKDDTKEGHDGCLGMLPGVMNACCGHGIDDGAFVQFWNKEIIRGKRAIEWLSAYVGHKRL